MSEQDNFDNEQIVEVEVMDEKEYEDFYQKLRQKIMTWLKSKKSENNKWTEYIVAAPDLFYLLVKLVMDKEVRTDFKVKLVFALTYFIMPFDLIPEGIIGVVGLIDDIALAAYVLNDFINKTDDVLIKKYWLGEGEVLDVIKKIVSSADEMLGSGLYRKLIDRLNRNA